MWLSVKIFVRLLEALVDGLNNEYGIPKFYGWIVVICMLPFNVVMWLYIRITQGKEGIEEELLLWRKTR